jgi:class 3 adenylate cyclase/tetratricopeptide (TPR) repeat protein
MCGAALAARSANENVRRHVVVLFADLEGFTSMSQGLDPELLRAIMDRYFRLTAQVIWRYGGLTEKFIGDAVMAVFGMPVARENDALRAVQAASDIIDELDLLNVELDREYGIKLAIRVAVHSGPVSASYDAGGDFRVVGDTVNTASRLQSAAPLRQVLVGEPVAQAVRSRVQLEAVPPLSLKGKGAPARAWRLVSLDAPGDTTSRAPLIGRDVELLQLRQAYDRALQRGRGCMVTLLGPPGIGKSRLAAAFQASLGERGPVVLSGQAISYGQGVTYRPIVELLESAPGTWAAFASKGVTDPAAARAQACLAGLSREGDTGGPEAEVEEIAWALRAFVASVAERGPLLLVWEDLHWAEPTLLDVIEYLGDELSDSPVMQLCVARPELLDLRPAWSGGRVGAVNLELAPLTTDETLVLVGELRQRGDVVAHDDDEVCALVASACEGNPLFAELMLDIAGDRGSQPMPQTIQALFAARLDQLDVDDRLVLEMAAVAGRDFLVPDVEHALLADARSDIDLGSSLDRLRRMRLVTGNRLSIRHSFAQAFGRDTAYEMTAKRNRLRWHLALADRATAAEATSHPQLAGPRNADLLPYHLEAALTLSRELHPNSPASGELGRRATAALTEQAMCAMDRRDLRAAAGLFERAVRALPAGDPRQHELAIRLSDTWLDIGDRDRAHAALGNAPGGDRLPVEVEIQRELIDLRHGLCTPEHILEVEQRIEPRIAHDDPAWCRFHQLRAHRHLMNERAGAADASLAAALERAQAMGDSYQQRRILRTSSQLTLWGPTPVPEGLQRCSELACLFADSRVSLVTILSTTGGLLAFDGQFAEARERLATAAAYAADLRMRGADVGLAHLQGMVESIVGEHRAAADHFSRARSILRTAGNANGVALLDAYTARELVAAGGPVPAPYPAMTDDEVAAISDPRTGALTAVLCARAAAGAGDVDRVRSLVEWVRALAGRTDDLYFQGTVHQDIAGTLVAAGRLDEALVAATAARERYRAKGVRAVLPRADDLVSQLERALRQETGGG